MTNYKLTLEEQNRRLDQAADIILTRDQEIQEWDDLNTELTKKVKELTYVFNFIDSECSVFFY